jgi:ABC-type multidrug transport system fused ATPase/permease subunit
MLRDTPILILDEPQSGLDAEAAAAVEESWGELTEDRTTFVIAHELRLVRDVDLILVLQEGRVAETGTHKELIERGGLYARLYTLQEGNVTPRPRAEGGADERLVDHAARKT